MKTKIMLTALLSILSINANAADTTASFSGQADVSYASQYHRRGEIVSQDAIQSSLGTKLNAGSFELFLDLFSSESTETGSDATQAAGGVTVPVSDRFDLRAGLISTDIDASGNSLEAFVGVGINTLLSPEIMVIRDTSDELYTVIGELTDTFQVKSVDVSLTGFGGWTELTSTDDSTFYGAELGVSKQIKQNVNIGANVAWSDNDSRDSEWIYGAGLNFKF